MIDITTEPIARRVAKAQMGISTALLTMWDTVKYIEKGSDGKYPTTEIAEIKATKKQIW